MAVLGNALKISEKGGAGLEGLNPGARYFERNQKKKREDAATDNKSRFDAFLGNNTRLKPGKTSSSPFQIGPRI